MFSAPAIKKSFFTFLLVAAALLAIDQAIKHAILYVAKPSGLDDFVLLANGTPISLALVFNTGVAFSFLTFLEGWLKFLQLGLLLVVVVALYANKTVFMQHYVALGFVMGGGVSNILDRFLHGGVVDYIYWHYGFDFPIFNAADIFIDCGIALYIWQTLRRKAR